MPLLIQNKRLDGITSTAELFEKYPLLEENAREFRSMTPVDVDPKDLLYVQQREFAATTPADGSVSVIGSEDATTCHLVVLRHTGSGAVCLAHCDGYSTQSDVPLIVKAVMSLSDISKEGRLELHLSGGFKDDKKISAKLSHDILTAFQEMKEDIHLETCCITEMNDVVVDGTHRPIVYGISVNVRTGKVFRPTFTYKGPAKELRSARRFNKGQMANTYDSSRELVQIGPCKWSKKVIADSRYWLKQDDETILEKLSTSPKAEPPNFVADLRATFQFILDHHDSDKLFPGGQPQFYHRTANGDWKRAV
ncbi:protein N-terminal asparagine amidohydrolase-like [Pungitius pungitius]|uniref:protein N-terminal asparagine amidohydrolase-like n=1 Tax=Pungitius pungitius TaxID=134920 RepID=UPI002E12B9D6